MSCWVHGTVELFDGETHRWTATVARSSQMVLASSAKAAAIHGWWVGVSSEFVVAAA